MERLLITASTNEDVLALPPTSLVHTCRTSINLLQVLNNELLQVLNILAHVQNYDDIICSPYYYCVFSKT